MVAGDPQSAAVQGLIDRLTDQAHIITTGCSNAPSEREQKGGQLARAIQQQFQELSESFDLSRLQVLKERHHADTVKLPLR
jgi:hypothetical protein